ncbi:uncharacterized protein LOC144201194 [Stigmatopora nigra]
MEDEKAAGEFQSESASSLPLGSILPLSSPGQSDSDAKPNEKCQDINLSYQSALSSSDEEKKEEVEVKVKLEIHNPPAHLHHNEDPKPESPPSILPPPKRNPITLPPPPVLTCSILPPSRQTTPPTLPSRHWAPPKGFWRVARPETLLLNGMDPHNTAIVMPCKGYIQGEEKDAGLVQNVGDATETFSDLRNPPMEDECDGLSTSMQGKGLYFDEKVKVRQSANVKLKERQENCRDVECAVDKVDYEGTF